MARASRIWVEGLHDAELVEKVWGHDLRVEGIVVEPLHGVDDLATAVKEFSPGPERRLGILVDHLLKGTKEERVVAEALAVPGAAGNIKIVGHPFIDIWQAVKPQVLGIRHGRRRLEVRTGRKEFYVGWDSRIKARKTWQTPGNVFFPELTLIPILILRC